MYDYDTLTALAYAFLALAAVVACLTGYGVALVARGARPARTPVVTVTRTTDARAEDSELQRVA